MSKHPRRWLMVDTSLMRDACLFSLEALGAALIIVAWEAAGHQAQDEATIACVCRPSATKWRSRRAEILAARDFLKRGSHPRATFKRDGLSAAKRAAIYERDGEVCRYCGTTEGPFHIDHIVPAARGGSDDDSNLCVACAPCNFAKGARFNSEWAW